MLDPVILEDKDRDVLLSLSDFSDVLLASNFNNTIVNTAMLILIDAIIASVDELYAPEEKVLSVQ